MRRQDRGEIKENYVISFGLGEKQGWDQNFYGLSLPWK